MNIAREIAEIALMKTNGGVFEVYAQHFFSALLGAQYLPLGGMHDGGADGIILQHVSQTAAQGTHFFQVSIEKDARSKIRRTIKSLRKSGRTVERLTYATTQSVPMLDRVEADLLNEIGVHISIRDREYFISHANDGPVLQSTFWEYLGQYVENLGRPGAAPLPTQSRFMSDPTIFVFLRQESDREEDGTFADSVTDALALWALQGTDPDQGILMSTPDIRQKILQTVPSVDHLVTTERVSQRLRFLASKDGTGRQVRWYRKGDLFALPFDTRQQLTTANAADEALRLRVGDHLSNRAQAFCIPGLSADRVGKAALVALQQTFESRGLQFAAFLEKGETATSLPELDEPVRLAVDQANPGPALRDDFFIATLATVRECLYKGGDDEREYLRRLAKTYAMLFVLRQDPKVVDYLHEMTSHFTLYVGADLIVRSLSERFLTAENQSASNLLSMARSAGATLILTEPTLEEVVTHLRAADREFMNHYSPVEASLPSEMYSDIPRIMIRAYFYNRGVAGKPQTWPGFIDHFCDYRSLHASSATEDLRKYLQSKYGMEYETRATLEDLVDSAEVSSLTEALLVDKRNNFDLARNDALIVHATYGKRSALGESTSATVFGYHTWWLTTETRVLNHTRSIVGRHGGARYMMRPDFLLNFFTLAPDMTRVRQTYQRLFPSTLGLELSRRMDSNTVSAILDELAEAENYDEARRLSVMAKCADLIKSDFRRRHLQTLDAPASDPRYL